MNNIEFPFEGHDLTKEVVMIQGRDNPDEPWSIPRRLCLVVKDCPYPYVTTNVHMGFIRYKYARLATPNIKPWTLKTAPRHLEVELEKGCFSVANTKTEGFVTFLKDSECCHLTWEQLTQYKQWDGTPCGVVE